MNHKIGDEVEGKFCFANGDDVESRGRIIKIDHAMSTPHYTIKTYDGRIAGAYEDDLFEVASPASQQDTCGRCGEPIVASPHVIGTWLADRAAPKIGEPGQRRGLCPDGELHQPRKTGR